MINITQCNIGGWITDNISSLAMAGYCDDTMKFFTQYVIDNAN